jgi:flagellar operon protein
VPEVDGVNIPFLPLGGVKELRQQSVSSQQTIPKTSFESVFQDELSKLKFSAHAKARLTSREISLNDSEISRLESAVMKAKDKGANDSLVFLDEKAFIVNVPNRTVVTVINKNAMESQVITNIDSAVFA